MKYLLVILFSLYVLGGRAENRASFPGDKVVTIDEFIRKDTPKDVGFFNVYIQDGRYYLEVPDDMLRRDILVAVTIIKGTAQKERSRDARFGYGGDSVFDRMIRFIKNRDRIEIVSPQVFHLGDSTGLYVDYYQNQDFPAIASFEVKARSGDSYLVDIMDLFLSDSDLFALKGAKESLKLGGYQQGQSYALDVKAFPENINFRSIRSYGLAGEVKKGEFPSTLWEVGSSWYLLPEKPMVQRVFDERVGYFAFALDGMVKRGDWMDKTMIATRWRLEPRPEDVEKYLRGELVEPVKPIVFYIDRATPEFLVPYFIQAVNVWQGAFEKVGFKNAIYGKLAPTPEEDPDYCEGDIRYPLVSYKASPIANAYGPMVFDPRSGEIITSHIAIFHSVLELIQRWYFVMCGAVDPRAREYPLSQEVMGELAATVLTHEVGHTLGLRHHFMGSTAYPVDSLRSKSFIRAHGLGTSIMDYQRFNYVAQPGDGLEPRDLLPRIGMYDEFAIEWGYRYFPEAGNLKRDNEKLRAWVDERRQDPKLFYIEEMTYGDPRVQSEDSGDDVIKANRLGMNNLKYIMAHLEEWTDGNDPYYYVLRKRYLSVLSQYQNYIEHVLRYVGGRYSDNPTREEEFMLNQPVLREKEEEAWAFLEEYLCKEQDWLFVAEVMEKTGVKSEFYEQEEALGKLTKLLLRYSALHKNRQLSEEGFTADELLNRLYSTIFEAKGRDGKLSQYDQALQNGLLQNLVINVENPYNLSNGVGVAMHRVISKIKQHVRAATEGCPDALTASHYKTLYNFITLWEKGRNKALIELN
ncbi:zinc-dependent metalloprotease [Butyricimonas virosa]|uniref:zinc-dependent metalloprotease n=1 Tax=Butyricimonas virosa TaxID=544645 RepID=UPI002665F99A|nr:zinc-dependent metalloprotease [Butyricimonas virosa]